MAGGGHDAFDFGDFLLEFDMRVQIDLSKADIQALDDVAKRRNVTRSAVIHEAITRYVQCNRSLIDDAFGLWGIGGDDGSEYQRKIRSEW